VKIYTRSGDAGETGLFGGQRVAKNDARVAAYGDVDELNSYIGWACSLPIDQVLKDMLVPIQSSLFTIGADLATPPDSTKTALDRTVRIQDAEVARLEAHIDRLDADLPPLTSFILPGGTSEAAALQICRAVCRRGERSVVALSEKEEVSPGVIVYLNRLSDLLFVMARWQNHAAEVEEPVWRPARTSPPS
jgi:cob(I)alamin adenosyltransferase